MYKLVCIVIAAFTETTTAQGFYGNYGGYDWSAGKKGATLAETAAGKPIDRLDNHFKNHDIDYRIQNAQSPTHSSSYQAHRNMFDRMTGNTYQAMPSQTTSASWQSDY